MAREISKRVGRTSITINQYNIFANDDDENEAEPKPNKNPLSKLFGK